MPYLPQEKRDELRFRLPETGAELNYVIYNHVKRLLAHRRRIKGTLRYDDYAEVLAAIEGAKGEYLRHDMEPYEDRKREENGPV